MSYIKIEAKQGGILFLGREGETNVRQIVFDISDWVRDLGPGVAQLKNQRMGDIEPYLCPVEQNEDTVYWTITNVETAHHGKYGKCELSYIPNESGLAKSAVWTTIVSDALGEPSAEMPEPMQGYLDQIAAVGAGALAAAQQSEAAKADAESAKDAALKAQSASEQIAKDVAQAKSDALEAKNAAVEAKTKAENAQSASEKAKAESETAKTGAETAQKAAEDAKSGAEAARQGISDTLTQANQSKVDAQAAQANAQNANTAAQLASAEAQAAKSAASQNAQAASSSAQAAKSSETVATKKAGEAEQSAANAKASETAAAKSAEEAKKAASQSGGGGAPADWLASEGEPGHVLNRTHYKEVKMEPFEADFWELYDAGVPYYDLSEIFGERFVIIQINKAALTRDQLDGAQVEFNNSESHGYGAVQYNAENSEQISAMAGGTVAWYDYYTGRYSLAADLDYGDILVLPNDLEIPGLVTLVQGTYIKLSNINSMVRHWAFKNEVYYLLDKSYVPPVDVHEFMCVAKGASYDTHDVHVSVGGGDEANNSYTLNDRFLDHVRQNKPVQIRLVFDDYAHAKSFLLTFPIRDVNETYMEQVIYICELGALFIEFKIDRSNFTIKVDNLVTKLGLS